MRITTIILFLTIIAALFMGYLFVLQILFPNTHEYNHLLPGEVANVTITIPERGIQNLLWN